MSGWNPPDPPPDSREEPECCCPVEGPADSRCPMHAWRSGPLYQVVRIRDAQGTSRTGYAPEDEDVKF